MYQYKNVRPKPRIIALCAVSLVFLGFLGYLLFKPTINLLDSWGALPRPERLTELYFTDHTALPSSYTVGDTQDVAFTIHNIEYRPTTYTYEIRQISEDEKNTTSLIKDKITLAADQTNSISRAITLGDTGERAQVLITLTYDAIRPDNETPTAQSQSIHYWVKKKEG